MSDNLYTYAYRTGRYRTGSRWCRRSPRRRRRGVRPPGYRQWTSGRARAPANCRLSGGRIRRAVGDLVAGTFEFVPLSETPVLVWVLARFAVSTSPNSCLLSLRYQCRRPGTGAQVRPVHPAGTRRACWGSVRRYFPLLIPDVGSGTARQLQLVASVSAAVIGDFGLYTVVRTQVPLRRR